MPRACAVSPRR
jgi:transposase